ncbi:hypothetical protein ACIPF8_18805 [Collimonas sp. NPDC087041]|uniref:hypothetical protein n=1 Tax=Collimonas sp. NPDC087041 TaxID=3363960 RepID=UPI00381411EB
MNRRLFAIGFFVIALFAVLINLGIRYNLSKSDWAAWVQAIGSIGAILAAVGVVQFQHIQQARLAAEAKRLERRGRLNALMAIFTTICEIVDDCASMVHKENIVWPLQAERLLEAKKLLGSIPIFELPDHVVVLRISQISEALQRAKVVAEALKTNRNEKIREMVKKTIGYSSVICSHGIADVTILLSKCSTASEIEKDLAAYEQINENAKLADEVWAELRSEKQTNSEPTAEN